MHLMREIEVPQTPTDAVFRTSRLYAVLFVLVCLTASVALVFLRWPHQRLAYCAAAAILVILLLFHRIIAARFHPSNWLVRLTDEGLYIHFRSYLNERLPSEDPTVVFISFTGIRSARIVREKVIKPDTSEPHTQTTQTTQWVEMELSIDPTPLATVLASERARAGASERRWYGRSATLYRDYPVIMQTLPFLRVQWRAVPRASVFLKAIQRRVQVLPKIAATEDFFQLQNLPREQQQKRIRDLDQRGDTIGAVYLARKLYSLNLTEATGFVKGLRGGTQS